MIEPSKVLDCLKEVKKNENLETRSKRLLNFFHYHHSLAGLVAPLFDPPVSGEFNLKKIKKTEPPEVKYSKFSLDFEYIGKVCNDKFFITPTEGGLDYINESLQLFESCLTSLPNFTFKEIDKTDSESYFNTLLESFYSNLDKLKFEVEINEKDSERLTSLEVKSSTNTHLRTEEDHTLIKQLFIAILLSCNWSIHILNHTNTAYDLSKSDFNNYDKLKILKTALELKESNRNYVFYNNVSQQLWELLKSKDTSAISFTSEFMQKIAFINNIVNTEMSYEPNTWNKLKSTITESTKESPFPSKSQHEHNLSTIRNEMNKRMSTRSLSEYLRLELDDVNAQMTQLETKNEELLTKLESLRKQFDDLNSTINFDFTILNKHPESKKLPSKLSVLFSHLNNFTNSNPLRDVTFKVSKDENSFQMTLSAPKDLLFPSVEATKFSFPLVFQFELFENEVVSKQISTPKLCNRKTSLNLALDKFMGLEEEVEYDFGLKTFKEKLPEDFHQSVENLYKLGKLQESILLAQEFVWNLYVLESYKTNNKSILSKILPPELQDTKAQSKYTYKENTWILSNEAASVTLSIEHDELGFKFTDFEKTGQLEAPKDSKLLQYIKENYELSKESLSELSKPILEYFNNDYKLIHLSVLFESYCVLFDHLSS